MRLTLFLLSLLSFFSFTFSISTQAACPKNKKEWQAKGPALLVKKASLQAAPVSIPDFSKKFGKLATGSALLYKDRKADFVMVQAQDKETSLYLSGVMKCDTVKKEPVLLSLSWVLGDKSGMIKVTAQ